MFQPCLVSIYVILIFFICRFLKNLLQAVKCSRKLKCLSLGCLPSLVDYTDQLLPLLAEHHSTSLEILHIASVKENPDSYGLIDFPDYQLSKFINLKELGLDYDYLTNDMLSKFTHPHQVKLEKLVIHVHGIDETHEKIPNATWRYLVLNNPSLEVTLNLLHTEEGADDLVDLLQPCMPLAHLRMFFCGLLNEAALTYIARHCNSKLRSVCIIDEMPNLETYNYRGDADEDPFVMMAWKCPNLVHFSLFGNEL